MGYLVALILLAAVVGVRLLYRVPLRSFPRYRFNSIVPRLLNTGAVTCLGYCFVRGSFIRGQHRAHEQHHHNQVVALGRATHLYRYIRTFLVLLWRTKAAKAQAPNGRLYLMAYYDHPEEKAARIYEGIHAHTWPAIGRAP